MTGAPPAGAARRVAAMAYVTAVTAWMVWMAWLPARFDAGPVTGATAVMAALTYRAAGIVCHQQPGRSFHHGPWPWPVCARCAGLYGGAAAGGVLSLLVITVGLGRRTGRDSVVPLPVVRGVLLAAAAPTALLWGAEWIGGYPFSNLLRCSGAVPLGAAVSAFIVLVLFGVTLADTPRQSGVH